MTSQNRRRTTDDRRGFDDGEVVEQRRRELDRRKIAQIPVEPAPIDWDSVVAQFKETT